MAGDGWPASAIFAPGHQGLGLDDLAFLPGGTGASAIISANVGEANLGTRLTRNINLFTPLVAGASPDVTQDSMAIAAAMVGGIGIIHRHLGVEEQAAMVRRVKQFESGFILNPACLGPRNTVADAERLQAQHGCSGIPITENGRMGGRLIGLVTARDLEGVTDRTTQLTLVMVREVVHVRQPVTLRDACDLMQKSKVAKLPVVNSDMELMALICRGDLKRCLRTPEASRDQNRQLLVCAAVSPSEENAWGRAQALIDAGADLISLQIEDGFDETAVSFLKQLKESFLGVDVIAGKVNTRRQAEVLCEAGADGILVGDALGAEATAIYEVAKHIRTSYGVPVIADVGVRDAGQILKALCLGASCVTLDKLLMGTEEAPGDTIYRDGLRVKLGPSPHGPRPMEMGVPGSVVDKGSAKALLPHLLKTVKLGFQELGLSSLGDVAKALENGGITMERQLRPRTGATEAPKVLPAKAGSLHSCW